MERTKDEYLSLLQETISYYSVNPARRGVDSGNHKRCTYFSDLGQYCAIGRMMIEPEEFKDADEEIVTLLEDEGEIILKEEYRRFEHEFYKKLQTLHDAHTYWDIMGLTEAGKKYTEEIKDYIEELFLIPSTVY